MSRLSCGCNTCDGKKVFCSYHKSLNGIKEFKKKKKKKFVKKGNQVSQAGC